MKGNKVLQRILFSYLPVFFVIGLTLLLLAYLSLSEMSKRSALKANTLLAHNIRQTIDDALRNVDVMMGNELLNNPRIRSFFLPTPSDERQQTDYQAAAALNEMLIKNRIIHSAYMYRSSDIKVLTPTSFLPLQMFGDKQYVGSKISSLTPYRWDNNRIYRDTPEAVGVSVISLVKIANFSDRSLMIVNISTDSLNQMIEKMSESKLNFVELTDKEGRVIASKRFAQLRADREVNPDSGKELTQVRSEYTGWKVRSGIYDSSIVEWVSSLFYVWISFGFAVIVLGIVWLFYVTRRNYKPIQSVASQIETYSRQKGHQFRIDEKTDEFKYIESAIEQLIDQHSMLQVQYEENIVYRKRHIFLHLLDGEGNAGQAESKLAAELELLELQAPYDGLLTALVEIDQFHEFVGKYNRRDQHLLKQVIGNVVREIAEETYVTLYAEWVNTHQMAVLFLFTGAENVNTRAAALLEKLRTWIEHNLAFTVTVGVGNCQEQIGCLPESYRLAQQLLGYKSSIGTNRLIVTSDIVLPLGEMFKQLEHIRSICQSFRTGDPEWADRLHDLYRSVRTSLFSWEDLLHLFHMLAVHLHREMMELPTEFQEIWHKEISRRLDRILQQNETLDTIYAELDALLGEAFDKMRRLRESRNSNQMLNNVKRYIGEHIGNPELSLAQVSEEFGYNASYLSRIFKESFGVKFIDYVTQIRMERALELLKETQTAVQDIASTVGYTSSLSFIRAFKKHTGTTPGNFRKELPGSGAS